MSSAEAEGIERYKAAVRRIQSGESEAEEVDLGSGRVRLTPDAGTPNGVSIEVLETVGVDGVEESQTRPDPQTLEAMEKAKEAMGRFRDGSLDSVEIPLPTGGSIQLTRDDRAPGAFSMRSSEDGQDMLSVPFPPQSTRPEGFPEDLPFLSDVASVLMSVDGQPFRMLSWFVSEDPEAHLEDLHMQMTDSGWEDGGRSTASTAYGTMTVMEYRREGSKRTLMVNRHGEKSQIKLMEQVQQAEDP